MDHSDLSSLISALERGTRAHICVAFLENCGNRKTLCSHSQTTHNSPVCLAVKQNPEGLSSCYRCRMTVQKAVIRRRKSMGGTCTNGVYEYCHPVVYDDRVIAVVFVGNILTPDPRQRRRLERLNNSSLPDTMEQNMTPADCAALADILESYIVFLFDRYGIENKTYDPLIANIKTYIRENLSYNFSMAELAAAFNYTEKYLGRMFKARTGQSVKAFCNAARVAPAKKLLTDTKLGIAAIAEQLGFSSIAYFDRVFFKITGLSPQQYREALDKTAKELHR